MKIAEVVEYADYNELVKKLRGSIKNKDLDKIRKQFDQDKHAVTDPSLRPDKIIKDDKGKIERVDKKNRILLPFQKLIVNSAVSFAFGNPVNISANAKDNSERTVLQTVKRILYKNKIDSFNRSISKDLFKAKEVAEIWYIEPNDEPHDEYGFPSKMELKVMKASSWEGNELIPVFDTKGDLVLFARYYLNEDLEKKKTEFFDIYTSDEILYLKKTNNSDWASAFEKEIFRNIIKKIPVIYAQTEQTEWEDVQSIIDRLEFLISNFGDTNDYNGSPILFLTGELHGFSAKGEAGKVFTGDKGADGKYLSWEHAPESIKLEIEMLLRFLQLFSKTPDTSFENVKGMSQISGVALKMLFMDAHLKVQDKREYLDAYLQRRISVILSFLGEIVNIQLAKACQTIQIDSEIVPYMIDDLKTKVDVLTSATGGQPILSQKTAIQISDLVPDVEVELKQIQDEQVAINNQSIGATYP